MTGRRFLQVLLVTLALVQGLAAEPIKSMEFRDQEIRDILLALGGFNNVSIIPDETVTGKASYVFSSMEFDQALETFLGANRLGLTKKNGVYYVSKVSLTVNDHGNLDLAAADVPLRTLIQDLSQKTARTILVDNLPNDPVTLNVKDGTLGEILGILVARYPDYYVESKDKYDYIRNRTAPAAGSRPGLPGENLVKTGDRYTWKVEKGRFRDLLADLFRQAGLEYVMLTDHDSDVLNLSLKDQSFDEALRALLLQGNADYSMGGGVYYILEVQRKDLLKKYQTNVILPFQYISAGDFVKLLPAYLNAPNLYRLDEKGNKIVLSGLMEEIKPLWDFIALIDKPTVGPLPLRVDLDFLKTDDVFPLLPPDLAAFGPLALPGKTSFLIALPDNKKDELDRFVRMVDKQGPSFPVRLRYLKSDDLVAKLPPSIQDSNILKTNDPSLVFFKGSARQRAEFLRDLDDIDVPRPQIRYELLVLEFDDGNGVNLTSSATVQGAPGTTNAFTGTFSNLMTLNFDVISNFGINFGLNLTAEMDENKAKVLADTTLNGISGEKISFQNTTTTRYNDTETSVANGNTTTSSVVRELTSGLLLNLVGWISADDMITLQVDSTLSKQTASASGSSAPPSTSEKKFSSTVRTPSGRPIIISGLKQEDIEFTVAKTPVLGDIPLLGLLFQQRSESVAKTEFTIYLVPILERPGDQEESEDHRLMDYYRLLVKKP